MTIQLNNRPTTFANEEALTIARIMELQSFHFKMLVIKLNQKLIPKEQLATTWVHHGDSLDIIHLVSGG